MSIIVFGSINMDLVTRAKRLPLTGETLLGHSFTTVPGGKGANQAVACAKLGAKTQMVGRVGGDSFGQTLIEALEKQGVYTEAVFVDSSTTSGIATITVDDQGQNNIIVVQAANANVANADLERLAKLLTPETILLLQLEIPLEIVLKAAKLAKAAGATVILDPAPAQNLPDELYKHIDFLTPNETEAAAIVGFTLDNLENTKRAARILLDKGVKNVIIKLAERGVFVSTETETRHYPALQVKAIDTVAAGDAFNGALAEALNRNSSLEQAIQQAIQVGAYAVTKSGAQSAMPNNDELSAFLKSNLHALTDSKSSAR